MDYRQMKLMRMNRMQTTFLLLSGKMIFNRLSVQSRKTYNNHHDQPCQLQVFPILVFQIGLYLISRRLYHLNSRVILPMVSDQTKCHHRQEKSKPSVFILFFL